MKEFRGWESARAGRQYPADADHREARATAIPQRRRTPWGRIAAAGLIVAGWAWAIDCQDAGPLVIDGINVASGGQPPAPDSRRPSRTAENNNRIMMMGPVWDLDGIAIAYTAEADRLVHEGKFRLDLSPARMASLLDVDRATIASARAPDEVDPDAVLFRARAGTLTGNFKRLWRPSWRSSWQEGKPLEIHVEDWAIQEFAFTLNRLRHPSDEEEVVLSAIVRAAAEIMPRPGDGSRAIGVCRGLLEPRAFLFSAGMLPLEAREGSVLAVIVDDRDLAAPAGVAVPVKSSVRHLPNHRHWPDRGF